MWDCDTTKFIRIDSAFIDAKIKCHQIKVKAHCSLCKQEIDTSWFAGELEGLFISTEANFSELWDSWLPRFDKIVCSKCASF